MENLKGLAKGTICIFIVIVLLVSSCSNTTEQKHSRSIRTSSFEPLSETETNSEDSNSYEGTGNTDSLEQTNESETSSIAEEYDFELMFSNDFQKMDYGKTVVNVYKAKYATMSDSWSEDWFVYGFGEIKDWCLGIPITINGVDFYLPDKEISRSNIKSIRFIKLRDLEGYDEILERTGIKDDAFIPCWTYIIEDFPQEFGQLSYFKAPTNLETLQYAYISAQFVDNLPVYGRDRGIGFGCATYEWPGVVPPSRLADSGIIDSDRINPTQTCLFTMERGRYSITETLQSSVPLVPPEECLDEIKEALTYEPDSPTDSSLRYIWGKKVEVYCAELTYVVLDTSPRNDDESEEDRKHHELYLIPVWELYYIITDPANDQTLFNGQTMINAVTGESLYSEAYGPDENSFLYPDLLSQI